MSFSFSPSSAPRAHRPGRARSIRGFTVLEMMVVLTIIGVIVAVGAPGLRSFLMGQQVKSLAMDMTTDLLLARNQARNRDRSVSVTRSGDSWNAGWTIATTESGELIGTRNASASDVTVSGAPATITFDRTGRVSSPTSEVRVSISGGGASRCVGLGLSGLASSTVGACT